MLMLPRPGYFHFHKKNLGDLFHISWSTLEFADVGDTNLEARILRELTIVEEFSSEFLSGQQLKSTSGICHNKTKPFCSWGFLVLLLD